MNDPCTEYYDKQKTSAGSGVLEARWFTSNYSVMSLQARVM